MNTYIINFCIHYHSALLHFLSFSILHSWIWFFWNKFVTLGLSSFLHCSKARDIHTYNERAFCMSRVNGHSEIAHGLINLGESEDYGKININADNEYAFYTSCKNEHNEIVHWSINLGESGDYGKIDPKIIDEYIKSWIIIIISGTDFMMIIIIEKW